VRNVRVNSTPENRARKKKCSFRRDLSRAIRSLIVRFTTGFDEPFECPFVFPLAFVPCFSFLTTPSFSWNTFPFPLVSGNAMAKNSVSTTRRIKVRIAGTA